ncbi:unnamed protein product [Arctia plantaginis]|uniref:Uncharacterized protein n=1 Tax=Arctia plantaginis TaxID=874455 RepID=A0A8S1BFG0_ARCPL|nr:unnamed protein product [Arctia plantaginis]
MSLGYFSSQHPEKDRRNVAKGVKPLNYGPFSSYAPSYDGTFATLTKEESHLLYHTLPAETGQGNEEMLRFAPDSPWALIYDMETLFPDKKQQQEQTPAKEDNVKVDIDQLRSLSELGIDVEYLNEIGGGHRGLAARLRHRARAQAHARAALQAGEGQRARVCRPPPPWHLSLWGAPPGRGGRERAGPGGAGPWRHARARAPPTRRAVHALSRPMGVTSPPWV